MPERAAHAHKIAAGQVGSESGYQREVTLEQCIHDLVPLVAVRQCRVLPKSAGFAETVLLVVIDVIDRVVLNLLVREHRFRKPVPMLHGAKSPGRGIEDVGMHDIELCMVHRRAKLEFIGFIQRSPKYLCRCAKEFDAFGTAFREASYFLAR